ncbi:hypothetical protein LRN70_24005, partial [Escherichia coli]|uniref:hypothetical protein n=1 Tax=Escherichia coli TaxID=562 RepID=UPI001F3E7E58
LEAEHDASTAALRAAHAQALASVRDEVHGSASKQLSDADAKLARVEAEFAASRAHAAELAQQHARALAGEQAAHT